LRRGRSGKATDFPTAAPDPIGHFRSVAKVIGTIGKDATVARVISGPIAIPSLSR
jgi:hypothetical protein